jgi:diaminopimelate decarboxylase
MLKGKFPTDKLKAIPTPFYYYDTELLNETLNVVAAEAGKYNYRIHYAVKANANPRILSIIAQSGLGADCVSGGEIQAALKAGFPADSIVFAGVGKADWEIELGLDSDIFCFNAESAAELRVIRTIAAGKGKTAPVALRINPEIDAHTHAKITTGMKENKFGINLGQLNAVLDELKQMSHIKLIGIHFHIGSQITDLSSFQSLAIRVNEIQDDLEARDIRLENINFGGGLGIDYYHPNHLPVAAFENYFAVIHQLLKHRDGQHVHFEPGRSIVGQCGTLISRALYVKEGETKRFVVLDAGFTELIRPAMYDAYHRIENITSDEDVELYDVVGPICESSDVFGREVELNKTRRGDLLALRSAGAYGEVMASHYNCRKLPESYFSDTI